jgi:6-phosphogluconolactonase
MNRFMSEPPEISIRRNGADRNGALDNVYLCCNTTVKTILSLLLVAAAAAQGAELLVLSGSNPGGGAKGIYAYRFNDVTGELKPAGLAVETTNPSFLAVDARGQFLYAVNEVSGTGMVSAFAIDRAAARLTLINQVSSKGSGPCHLALDATGRWLAVANYSSGSVAVLPVGADGKLSEAAAFDQHRGSSVNHERQTGPHAHEAVFSPDNRFLLVPDLGLDQILVYRFDAAKGTIAPNDPPFGVLRPGSGPRHLVFHPNGKIVYVLNEMASTVTAFRYDAARGALQDFQTLSALPAHFTLASTAAEIAINAAGTVLYTSNRGHDSIAMFAIDPERFRLAEPEFTPTLGRTPRHFTLDPDGGFLLVSNQDSDNIVVFHVHPRTGELTPTKHKPVEQPRPVCLVFVK